MSPLQIWLPTLSSSLSGSAAQRDSQRAFEVWNGESTVWMLPELKKTTWWSEGPGRRVVAIPSERLEKINIYHAGENGCVVGFAAKSIFPNGRIDGLLKLWLNFTQLDPVELYSPPATIHLEVPRISRRKVEFRKIVLKPIPHGMLPIVSVKRLSDEVWTKWPPTSKAYKTVSPDSESDELYGPFVRDDSDAIATGRSLKDKTIRTMFLFARWPEPLGSLILRRTALTSSLPKLKWQQSQETVKSTRSGPADEPESKRVRMSRTDTVLSNGRRFGRSLWPLGRTLS